LITITTQPPTGEIEIASPATAVEGPSTKPVRRHRTGRWLAKLTIAGLSVAILATGGWYIGLPHYRPPLKAGEKYGIDVSNHQGTIDWAAVADDKIDYAYIKATEGNDFVDKRFSTNWAQAKQAGVARGAYHFFTLCSSGRSQAENFLKTVPTDAGALPPAVDLEYSACSGRPSAKTFQRELTAFVDLVEEKTHQEVVLYVMPNFESRYPIEQVLPRDRWERRLFRRPATDEWVIWQTSAKASIDGIGEPTDLDVWRSAP
jgi:lysozyme